MRKEAVPSSSVNRPFGPYHGSTEFGAGGQKPFERSIRTSRKRSIVMSGNTAAGRPGLSDSAETLRAPLMRYFSSRIRERCEAEDLTQEVFARMARHPVKSMGKGGNAYVFTIAANLLRDRARRAVLQCIMVPQDPTNLAEQSARLEHFVDNCTPDRILIGRETLKKVVRLLGELDQKTLDIFILSRLEHMPHREISRLHGLSISSIEKHVIKATAYLSAKLEQ